MAELQRRDLKTDKRPYNFKKKSCPLSFDGAPKVDYKNVKLGNLEATPNFYGAVGADRVPPLFERFLIATIPRCCDIINERIKPDIGYII